ncbi:NTP transferase domain-containing protein [Halorhabdus sp. CUG00001]|uniref:NTP transferase domain-containing protein n=1 Tax=Halorhabdus sp. CUG00001 TaxID=2600297 RepID=UPI00131C011E|nr:NTP transferase domain-containing protein [Halorhabdus sp. CUG00001]
MCGGRGTRLDVGGEKPLVEIGGRALVDRVADALTASSIDRAYAVTSPNAPRTREYVSLPRIDAPGDGYVPDLQYALDRIGRPVLTVAADLPLLAAETIDAVVTSHEGNSMTACVPVALKRRLGVTIDTTVPADGRDLAPSGVNVIAAGDQDRRIVFETPRLAVNVNHVRDLQVAEALRRSEVLP